MYRIIDGRGSGKTSRLMLLAKETGAAIACSNPWAMAVKIFLTKTILQLEEEKF